MEKKKKKTVTVNKVRNFSLVHIAKRKIVQKKNVCREISPLSTLQKGKSFKEKCL